MNFWWIFGRLLPHIKCINMALEALKGSVALILPSPLSARIQTCGQTLGNAFNNCHTKLVDQIIYDKTTQCIISLTASRLSNPNLPSALIKENESSRNI